MPRLKHFRTDHPEIDVRIDAEEGFADFVNDDVDIAIRYGDGDYPGLRVDRFLTEDVFPVCSPKLLDGPHPLRRPEGSEAPHAVARLQAGRLVALAGRGRRPRHRHEPRPVL